MLQEIIDNLSPERLRNRSQEAVRDARTRINRARHDVHNAREQGRVQLWSLQAGTLERAHDVLNRAPERLEPVVKPLQKVVDERLEVVVSPPIGAFDDLNAKDVRDAVRGLDLLGLERVERYEKAHKNRKTVLDAVEIERPKRLAVNGR